MKKLYLICKRVLDFIFSIILFIILLPLMLLVGVLIKFESKGSVIFKQLRTGKNGKNFYIYKFRSMSNENDIHNLDEDNKITRVGKFIRKTSLDELPQLLNIIKGEMSFIGPRPWILDYYNNFTEEQKRRVNVTPGITGLAQVSGRNEISILKKIDYDLYYVDNISFILDMKILFLTIKLLILKDNKEMSKMTIMEEINELKNNKRRKE